MPKAYGYCRVSTLKQAASGLSVDAQKDMIQRYYEYRLKDTHSWGGFFVDNVSAGKINFLNRDAGHDLSVAIEEGDAIIFGKLDRAFRSLKDCLLTIEVFKDRKISIHLLDLGVDTSTAAGGMALHMVAAVAEFESRRVSERTAEAMASKRKRGETWASPPYPYRNVRRKGKLRLEYDEQKRQLGCKIVEWRTKGYTWRQIYLHLFKNKVRHRNGKSIGLQTIVDYFRKEMQLRAKEKLEAESQEIEEDAT